MATTATKATAAAKEEVKATPAKTTTAKTTATKAPAKKTTATRKTKTTTAKKTTATKRTTTKEIKADVFVQYNGNEYSQKAIMEKVVAAWEAEGKKASAIKSTKLYIKPEDGKAYYVVNEGLKTGSIGSVDL
ncbi:MAG: DUF6465 family protein [Eubacterium sp.]|nr:DUF6465 family protein [Eubacterium sp.]